MHSTIHRRRRVGRKSKDLVACFSISDWAVAQFQKVAHKHAADKVQTSASKALTDKKPAEAEARLQHMSNEEVEFVYKLHGLGLNPVEKKKFDNPLLHKLRPAFCDMSRLGCKHQKCTVVASLYGVKVTSGKAEAHMPKKKHHA